MLTFKKDAAEKMVEDRPREFGSLQDSLAGTLVRANTSFLELCERTMKVIPGEAPEADPLEHVWKIFDKKASE